MAQGLPKVGVDRVGDHLHGDRAVLGWGDQRWISLTKVAPTNGPGFRTRLRPTTTSVSNPSRCVGLAVARAEDVGKIVHELEPAGLHHTEGYEPIQRRCVLALDLKHGPSRCFVRK